MNPVSIDRTDFYNPGFLVIQNGRIERLTSVDPRPEFPSALFDDFSSYAILPGFVDIHVHLPQFAIMGIGSGTLLEWLNDYTFPEESRFSDPDYATRISGLFFDDLIRNGTTTACIYCSVHESATEIAFEGAARRNIRAFIGKTMMDSNSPASLIELPDESIAASTRLHDKWDGANSGRLRYVFTPRFAGGCSMSLMQRVGKIAHDRGAFVQSHLSESVDEVRWIQSMFPAHRHYTDVYRDAGILGPRTVMGHCIHLNSDEISMLAASETSAAFCPYSNRTLRSGVMPFGQLHQAGIRVGLGTDIAGGPSLSMLRQMGEALNSANAAAQTLSVPGAFYLATLGGAKALGLEASVGSLNEGKDADFVVVDYQRAIPIRDTKYDSPEQILSRLCYRGDTSCVARTFVVGTPQL